MPINLDRDRYMFPRPQVPLLLLFMLIHFAQDATAETYYVNNQSGNDANRGTAATKPVKTIAKAVSLCNTSDAISLANTGTPYRESLVLRKLGGTVTKPFVIEGNGAVLNGLQNIPVEHWQQVETDLYLNKKYRFPYGIPYLLHLQQKLTAAKSVANLKAEQFFWDKDQGIYFRTAPGKSIEKYRLSGTLLSSGLQTNSSSYLVCRNLICEYFANDGFNIHGDCRGVRLENVIARHNGDDGISIHESGGLVVFNAHVHHNTYGIQDVNASRSLYHGLLAEQNHIGVSLAGGFHSVEDSMIRNNNGDQIHIAGAVPHHLVGGAFLPTGKTTLVLQNVIVAGDGKHAGLSVGNDSTAIVNHSVIRGCRIGVNVNRTGYCHLTQSLVADCQTALVAKTKGLFADNNIYTAGPFVIDGTTYSTGQWQDYLKATANDAHSKISPATIEPTGTVAVPKNSAADAMEKPVGPSEPIRLLYPHDE